MASINTRNVTGGPRTHEGAPAASLTPVQALERSILACLLWEKSFYEDGENIADRISYLCRQVSGSEIARIADKARNEMFLRHAPLHLAVQLARKGELEAAALDTIIRRPDELTEFLSLYWADGKCPLANQVKKGLAKAFTKFNEYSLAKYNRMNKPVKLRDVLFLSHAKPKDAEQAAVWKRLVDNELATPDTWEVALSGGEDKKTAWTRLLSENKLGGLALLRNLRNMIQAGVNEQLIKDAISTNAFKMVLPFRFIGAAKFAPSLEPWLEEAMMRSLTGHKKLKGTTTLLVDVSGSMDWDMVSVKSDLRRLDAAFGLAILLREVCEDVRIFSFSNRVVEIPARRGFALSDAINCSQPHSRTFLGKAVTEMNHLGRDRLIVITDEQSHDQVTGPFGKGYMLNVAAYDNGVGYGPWTRITGWSENVIRYVLELENSSL